jgi:hypothetical protein
MQAFILYFLFFPRKSARLLKADYREKKALIGMRGQYCVVFS